MMDDKEVEFYEEVKEEGSICASKSTMKVSKVNHLVVIISRPKNNNAGVLVAPKITIQKPTTFLYKDSKKVLWNYECNVTIPVRETSAGTSKEDQSIGSHTPFIIKGSRIPMPKMSKATRMGLRLIVGGGALSGKRLGRHLQGRVKALMLKDKYDHFGL
ncbi:hypothetical protein Gotur_003439, partial [Gossypium turneri]